MTFGFAANKIRLSACALLALLALSRPAPASEIFSRTRVLMGDVPVTVTVRAPESRRAAAYAAMERAFARASELENRVSEWRPESDIRRLNRSLPGRWIPLGPDAMAILQTAESVSRASGGAFDVTFASKPEGIDYRSVELDAGTGRARIRRHGMQIGVSGIAKGYIVERVSRSLKEAGFSENLVNAGGDVFASGKWEVAIRKPVADNRGRTLCALTVRDRAVSTSGNYERGPHLIEPGTGKPVAHHRSTTVIAREGAQADALATAAFILKTEGIPELMARSPGAGAIVIDEAGIRRFGKTPKTDCGNFKP